jgi:hypothetical protein
MDTNLGNALSGLFLLYGGSDSNNDSKDSSTTHTTNDSDAITISNNGGSSPISNAGSMDMTPTPSAAETKRRKYKKRGGTRFTSFKGSKKSKNTNQATVKLYVPGLADGRTASHCHTTTNDGKKPRGRKRVRKEYNMLWQQVTFTMIFLLH